jgi:hypothetical protein
MASPIPLPIRQAILERMRLHEDVATIAHTLHLCPRTVRNLRDFSLDATASSGLFT